MADPSVLKPPESPRWWQHACRWLWRGLIFFWTTIVLGLLINVIATRLTSKADFPADSPIGWMLRHLLLVSSLGVSLLLLTVLVGLVNSHQPVPAPTVSPSRPATPQQRAAIVSILCREYNKRLAQSLQGAEMMVLGLNERSDVIRSSAQLVFRRTDIASVSVLPPGTTIAQAYDDAGQGLLILGAPGAGKTTLLLALARELLTRAESDPAHPIPVILNLSSWASKKSPLAPWISDQLRLVYGIPSRLSQTLLAQEQWLLLLDGLDEVEASARSACIEAINHYREEHFVPLVVCSRSHEYETQQARLALSSAVEIQPLQEQEVMTYLTRIGKPTAAVRAVLRANPILKQLLTTPLMLSIMILTYRDKRVKDLPSLGTTQEQQQQIFEHYVTRMLERPVAGSIVLPRQTRQWLTWLALQMQQRHLTEFYLERLQPTWLPTKRARVIYSGFVGLVVGLVVGSFVELAVRLAFGSPAGPVAGTLVGLIVSVWQAVELGRRKREIRPVEAFAWSWRRFWLGLALALVVGLLFGLLIGLTFGLTFGLFAGLGAWFGGGLVGGISGISINEDARIQPNQGIRKSGRNALVFGIMSISLITMVTVLARAWVTAPLMTLFTVLCGGLFGSLAWGGGPYLEHYVLRYMLWCSGALPWRYIRFLEEACEHILLQHVGGGYRFIHPLLQDYFASLGVGTPPSAQSQSSPLQP